MIRLRRCFLLATFLLVASAACAHANARLLSVASVNGSCVVGPNGGSVQFWEVEPGKSYDLTITGVLECGNGGTDPTIGVRINSSSAGNWDMVANIVMENNVAVPGKYTFRFDVPANAVCTMPLFYCTTPGMNNTGLRVWRSPDDEFQAHLRMASFGPNCTIPTTVTGAACQASPTLSRTWSQVKQIYR